MSMSSRMNVSPPMDAVDAERCAPREIITNCHTKYGASQRINARIAPIPPATAATSAISFPTPIDAPSMLRMRFDKSFDRLSSALTCFQSSVICLPYWSESVVSRAMLTPSTACI